MNPAFDTAPACQPLASRLQRVGREQARVSRVVFDARLQHGLAEALDQPGLAVVTRAPIADAALLDLQAAEGRLQVEVDTAASPALRLALALPDDELACEVANAVLAPLLGGAGAAASGLRITGRQLGAGQAPAGTGRHEQATLVTPQARVAVRDVDDALARHLRRLWDVPQAGTLHTWRHLQLRGRLRLMERTLPCAVLGSLAPGDIVLARAAGAAPAYRWITGVGITMQAEAELDLEQQTLRVAQPPQLQPEPAPGGEADGLALDALHELQVPVAFEIDTARIGLGELASIRPGYVIELDAPLMEASVRLVCHGQTIGLGQLVAVGDQLGVRITRMEVRHDAAAQR
ncbi:type III secretion system cytoplasmic ring protein SctQ [Eleftheria terrae]|uniref:type III secretion system cytoplasmic ring protein SctQ n=1 Tax=Eleftheria terrae TaxID=1597781 RepID=UPI00263B8B55|nr:type III secretion system cytoplasmic ring protein SctQ [Eleftheria terrae]WKB51723.1 type III secretion system cytoplasmic ring protein SctQ [Eleftheria terrae]